ncbi:hypothetical protein CDAR_425761 [Caerostris darwini]|uniref:Uncharacterized protein n=1 Tax=Caerostris darwini TaxID=1538125 RepID=A0AAV4VZW8_9ARAC|nr:hypothetical protein CDAR_425761 [Caerostris darwini]
MGKCSFPVLPEEDKRGRNQKNQRLTCGIERTSPSMSVIGRESKDDRTPRSNPNKISQRRGKETRSKSDERD